MQKKYKNAPVVEAVFELRLKQDKAMDLTAPGRMFEKISKDFPIKEQRQLKEVEITQGPEGPNTITRDIERMFFLTADRLQFIQLGSNLMAVHCVKPYPTWAIFRQRIKQALSTLKDIAEIGEPERLGIRYINRIEIPLEKIDIDQYFEFSPNIGQGLPQMLAGFALSAVLPFKDNRDYCKIQLVNVLPESPGNSAYVLDIDYFMAKLGNVNSDQVMLWVDDAHSEVRRLFEGCITKKLMDVFGVLDGNE
jgi:uncharacterized protein (TIGR04255 family)